MTQQATKKRDLRYNSRTGVFKTWVGPNLISSQDILSFSQLVQETHSQGNPYGKVAARHKRNVHAYGYDPEGLQDIGGYFLTLKVQSTSDGRIWNLTGGNPSSSHWAYEGQLSAWDKDPNFNSSSFLQPSSISVLNSLGTIAISRMLPTNPLAGMGQFVGELRDVPRIPSIKAWQKTLRELFQGRPEKAIRGASDEYLNQVFGWAPFIGDLKKFHKVVKEARPQMEKFARGSGKLLRRTYKFPVDVTTVVQTVSQNYYPDPPLNTYIFTQGGVLTKTTRTETKRWCSAAFTYHLPEVVPSDNNFVQAINKFKRGEQMANRLFGARITPDLIYKLTPWSWALDWVSTAGSVVRNWSAFANDGLVMHHAYIMEEKTQDITYALTGVGSSAGVINLTQTFRYETKVRVKATPYGFGINPASFTGKQWSIIAALGISRQPLSLNF